jgi:hypothetical protein
MAEGSRRFPPPWYADKIPGGYVVRDANGQAIAYIYSRANEAEARQAKVLTADEARRIAINIARLPELLGKGERGYNPVCIEFLSVDVGRAGPGCLNIRVIGMRDANALTSARFAAASSSQSSRSGLSSSSRNACTARVCVSSMPRNVLRRGRMVDGGAPRVSSRFVMSGSTSSGRGLNCEIDVMGHKRPPALQKEDRG